MSLQGDTKTSEFIRRYWSEDAAVPKHERLSNAFVHAIADGFWGAGARLPAEAELVRATPCSLGTVQKALRTLADAAVVQRRRGSGTVVADAERPLDTPWHMRFHAPDDATKTVLPVFARVIGRTVSDSSGPWTAALGQENEDVVRLERMMSIDGRFDVYNLFCARAGRFPELVDTPAENLESRNLKVLMARTHRLVVHRIEQEMNVRPVSAKVAKRCGWPGDTTVSVLTVVGFDLLSDAMYYQEYHIPPNRLTLALGEVSHP